MSTFWKVMIGLVLTLPVGGYITGTLVSSQADLPRERTPIVISDAPSSTAPSSTPSAKPGPTNRPRSSSKAQPTKRPSARRPRENDDQDDRPGQNNDEGGPAVVRPAPQDVDDGDDGNGDDDSGPGDDDGDDDD